MAFRLASPAFQDGDRIPERDARHADNVSPPLEWKDIPRRTRSFAVIVEDPDAPSGTFEHWAIYNFPHDHTRLSENASSSADRDGFAQAVNDFGNPYYDGPQPPKGHGPHHDHFRVAALDVDQLPLSPEASVDDVWAEAKTHVLAEAELVGVYEAR